MEITVQIPKTPDNISEAEKDNFRNFMGRYSHEVSYIDEGISILFGNKGDRKCRFCERSYPEVRFSNTSHLVPESLGSNSFISFYECDECNVRFKVYDDNLAKFNNFYSSITGISGKRGVPKLKDEVQNFKLEGSKFDNGSHFEVHQRIMLWLWNFTSRCLKRLFKST